MIGRSSPWYIFMLLVGVVVATAWPGLAGAQGTTPTSGASLAMSQFNPVTRTFPRDSSGTDTVFKYTITRNDCKNPKLEYTFSLSVTGYQAGYVLQAWAGPGGTDCSGQISSSSVVRTCWQVGANLGISGSGATLTAKAVFTPAQMFGIGNAAGVAPILNSCDQKSDFFKTLQNFDLQFLLLSGPSTVAATIKQPIYYALDGPAPPDKVTASVADSCLHLQWSNIGTVTGDVTYQFYCAPNEGDGDDDCRNSALSDAVVSGTGGSSGVGGSSSSASGGAALGGGTATSAGAGGTGGSGGSAEALGFAGDANTAGMVNAVSAASDTLTAVADTLGGSGSSTTGTSTATSTAGATSYDTMPILDHYKCGSVLGKANTNGYTKQILENYTSYAVSVAVVDRYGNVGDLSKLVCMTPKPVDTFFDAYRSKGGKAGGGFCNIELRRVGYTLPMFCGAMLLVGWIRRRHRTKGGAGS